MLAWNAFFLMRYQSLGQGNDLLTYWQIFRKINNESPTSEKHIPRWFRMINEILLPKLQEILSKTGKAYLVLIRIQFSLDYSKSTKSGTKEMKSMIDHLSDADLLGSSAYEYLCKGKHASLSLTVDWQVTQAILPLDLVPQA